MRKKSGLSKWWLIILAILIAIVLIMYGYRFDFTGFGAYPNSNNNIVPNNPPKLLWDWLKLLIIPMFLVGLQFVLNHSEEVKKREFEKTEKEQDRDISTRYNESEQSRNIDNQRENSLKDYFDSITELLLKHNLKSKRHDTVVDIARAKTLAVLKSLDGKRKGFVLIFLHNANLIKSGDPVINLESADFSGLELENTELQDLFLGKVDFSNARLTGVHFSEVNFDGTIFKNADLSNGVFKNIIYRSTIFENSNLSGVSISNTSMSKSCITNTNLTNSIWQECIFDSCNFSQINSMGLKFDNLIFKSQTFDKVMIRKSSFNRVDFSNNNLSTVDFSYSDFFMSSFSKANLYDVIFDDSRQAGTNFSNSILIRVSFRNAIVHFDKRIGDEEQIPDANFTEVTVKDVRNSGANFTTVQLEQIASKEVLYPPSPTHPEMGRGIFKKFHTSTNADFKIWLYKIQLLVERNLILQKTILFLYILTIMILVIWGFWGVRGSIVQLTLLLCLFILILSMVYANSLLLGIIRSNRFELDQRKKLISELVCLEKLVYKVKFRREVFDIEPTGNAIYSRDTILEYDNTDVAWAEIQFGSTNEFGNEFDKMIMAVNFYPNTDYHLSRVPIEITRTRIRFAVILKEKITQMHRTEGFSLHMRWLEAWKRLIDTWMDDGIVRVDFDTSVLILEFRLPYGFSFVDFRMPRTNGNLIFGKSDDGRSYAKYEIDNIPRGEAYGYFVQIKKEEHKL